MLLLLLVSSVSGFRLELMYISLIINIRLIFTDLHGAIVHRNHFFCFCQQNISESKVKSRQAINHCKKVLEAAKLVYATKTKEYSQKLGSQDVWWIANNVVNNGKSIPPLFNGPEVLLSASDKVKLLKTFLRTLNLDDLLSLLELIWNCIIFL